MTAVIAAMTEACQAMVAANCRLVNPRVFKRARSRRRLRTDAFKVIARADLVKDIEYVEIDGGPHNVGWTHPEEVNEALLKFITGSRQGEAAAVAPGARMKSGIPRHIHAMTVGRGLIGDA